MKERRTNLIVIIIIFSSAFQASIMILPGAAEATTRFVGGVGPGNYATIQQGVDAANAGDTVFVYVGTYYEDVVVWKSISLIGEDKEMTIVNGSGTADVIQATANWVNISGFNVTNGGGQDLTTGGIELYYVQNSRVSNNTIYLNNGQGVNVEHSENNAVVDNDIYENGYEGIFLFHSANISVSNNNVLANRVGIWIHDSSHSTIGNNTISNNSQDGMILTGSGHIDIFDNIISHNQMGIYSDGPTGNNTLVGNSVFLNTGSGILVEGSFGNTIRNNNVSSNLGRGIGLTRTDESVATFNTVLNNNYGLYISRSNDNAISDNIFHSNVEAGVWIYYSDSNYISNNSVQLGRRGFYLQASDMNTLRNNNASSNSLEGFSVWSSYDNRITNNSVWDNDWGFFLKFSHRNEVTYNEISDQWRGVHLESSNENLISNNEFMNNSHEGIRLEDSENNSISANAVAHSDDGIILSGSVNNQILDNVVSYGETGIYVGGSEDNVITDNTISFNELDGIRLSSSLSNTLSGNSMTKNGIYITSETLEGWNSHTIDASNQVNGKPVFYWKNTSGGQVPSGAGQVILANCTGVSVKNQDVSDGTVGIEIGFSSYTTMNGNTVNSNLRNGIHLYASESNDISQNTVSANQKYGIYLAFSDGNDIIDNTVTGSGAGIHATWSNRTFFNANQVADNELGIYILMSNSAVMKGNNMSKNGIVLSGSSKENWNTHIIETSNTVNEKPVRYWKNETGGVVQYGAGEVILANCSNVIVENQIIGNSSIGIAIGFSSWNTVVNSSLADNYVGLYIEFSSNNTIFHNNFLFNKNQATSYGMNVWDNGYPDGGNYWSDYTGIDEKSGKDQDQPGSDGIGDTPYEILEGSNWDRYPLIFPYLPSPWVPINYPPSVNITSPAQEEAISGEYTITGTASDPEDALQIVEIKIDEGVWTEVTGMESWSFYWDTTNVTNGLHIIHARSFDGESYSTEVFVTVTVDNTISDKPDDWLFVAAAISIVIIVVLVMLVYILFKKRRIKGEEESIEPPVEEEAETTSEESS